MNDIKIYKNTKTLTAKDKPAHGDIPLCYVDTVTEYNRINLSNMAIEENVKRPLLPFEEFKTLDIALFDKNENRIDHSRLFERLSNSSGYSYVPAMQTEYIPTYFKASIVIEKSIDNNKRHNISAGCSDVELAKKLVAISGNAHERNIGPKNISINNNDTSHMSYTSKQMSDTDLLFIRSSDGYHYKGSQEEIDFETIHENKVNTWIGVDTFEGLISKPIDNFSFSFKGEAISIKTDGIKEVFDMNYDYKGLASRGYNIENYSSNSEHQPILLLKSEGVGFTIISHNKTLDLLHANLEMLYKLIKLVHYNGYKNLSISDSWISYSPIDYTAYSNKKFNSCHQPINLDDLLVSSGTYIDRKEYSIYRVETNNDNVSYSGIDHNGFVSFEKNNRESNDVENKKYISYFSPNSTIVYYEPSVYRIETKPIANISKDTEGIWRIAIEPIKSTTLNVDIPNASVFYENTFKDSSTYSLATNGSVLRLVSISDDLSDGLRRICNLQIVKDTKNEVVDLRKLGGGLSEAEADNYNLLDIGSVAGRPYRRGNTLIITLPIECKRYEEEILREVRKHCLGEDLPVLLYE